MATAPLASTTPSGIPFALLPPRAATPAPLLVLLAMAGGDTLRTEPYCRVGKLLHEQGWCVVSLDLPCHGQDRRAGEAAELAAWAARVAAGEDIVASFRERVDDVIGHLVEIGLADGERLAAAGTSRGGFLAFQAAAGNPRLRAVAAFSPVTELLALAEFAGQEENALAQRLALAHGAPALADRAVWLAIGHSDERVGTDRAIAFSRSLAGAAVAGGWPSRVALHVLPVPGHTSRPEWHDEAAAWLLAAFTPSTEA